jgi:hypothetical protein
MTRKADPPSRRPSRRKPSRPPVSQGAAPQPARASSRRPADGVADCDFGLAFSVVPALRRPPDA